MPPGIPPKSTDLPTTEVLDTAVRRANDVQGYAFVRVAPMAVERPKRDGKWYTVAHDPARAAYIIARGTTVRIIQEADLQAANVGTALPRAERGDVKAVVAQVRTLLPQTVTPTTQKPLAILVAEVADPGREVVRTAAHQGRAWTLLGVPAHGSAPARTSSGKRYPKDHHGIATIEASFGADPGKLMELLKESNVEAAVLLGPLTRIEPVYEQPVRTLMSRIFGAALPKKIGDKHVPVTLAEAGGQAADARPAHRVTLVVRGRSAPSGYGMPKIPERCRLVGSLVLPPDQAEGVYRAINHDPRLAVTLLREADPEGWAALTAPDHAADGEPGSMPDIQWMLLIPPGQLERAVPGGRHIPLSYRRAAERPPDAPIPLGQTEGRRGQPAVPGDDYVMGTVLPMSQAVSLIVERLAAGISDVEIHPLPGGCVLRPKRPEDKA